jgi:hypothetical protein
MPTNNKKQQVKDILYKAFKSKKVGEHQDSVEKLISEAIELLSEINGVDVPEVEKQLELGQQIEREHTLVDEQSQKIIALQHLNEKFDYYTDSKPKEWAEKELEGEEKETLGESRKKKEITEAKMKFNKYILL